LFLFFGWFKDITRTASGYKYVSGTHKHVIWGYMQVGEIEPIHKATQYDGWKLSHPHYMCRDRELNTAYIASLLLSFDNSISGWGTFKYDDSLVLTRSYLMIETNGVASPREKTRAQSPMVLRFNVEDMDEAMSECREGLGLFSRLNSNSIKLTGRFTSIRKFYPKFPLKVIPTRSEYPQYVL